MAETREGLAIWSQGGAGLGLEKEISSHSGLLRFPAVATPYLPHGHGQPSWAFSLNLLLQTGRDQRMSVFRPPRLSKGGR